MLYCVCWVVHPGERIITMLHNLDLDSEVVRYMGGSYVADPRVYGGAYQVNRPLADGSTSNHAYHMPVIRLGDGMAGVLVWDFSGWDKIERPDYETGGFGYPTESDQYPWHNSAWVVAWVPDGEIVYEYTGAALGNPGGCLIGSVDGFVGMVAALAANDVINEAVLVRVIHNPDRLMCMGEVIGRPVGVAYTASARLQGGAA